MVEVLLSNYLMVSRFPEHQIHTEFGDGCYVSTLANSEDNAARHAFIPSDFLVLSQILSGKPKYLHKINLQTPFSALVCFF